MNNDKDYGYENTEYESFAEAAETCVEVDSVTKPDPEKFRLYESIFQTYKAIHDALAPVYHAMANED